MLVAAAEGHTTISSATHGAPRTNLFPGLGVDRRFKHGETGLDPTEYFVYDTSGSYCIVKNDAGNTAKNLDGQNVFTRNSLRLLRSRISQFSKHETISSILKELVEASEELNVPYALFSGDGAPCIQINNRRRKAAHVYLSQSIARKPKANTQRGVCSLPPEMPRTPHEMQAFLQLSPADLGAAQSMEQHTLDPTNGAVITNAKWQTFRAVRFTASTAHSMCGASVFKCPPESSAQLLQAHEARIEKDALNTVKCARSPVLSKIYNTFSGNKYTAYGTEKEETARIVSTLTID
jgi:hypothetical protein